MSASERNVIVASGAGGGPRFQGFVGVSGILERKALTDVNAHVLYDGEPTIPPLHYYHNDIECYARFRYSATRRTAASRRLIVAGAYLLCSRWMR
jgi:hypothetical protein